MTAQRQQSRTNAQLPSLALLEALLRYHYLTLLQLMRVLGIRSEAHMQRTVKPAADAQYLTRVVLKRSTQRGSVPFVYTLGPHGVQYLRSQGLTVFHRYRPGEVGREYWHLNHTLAVNDVLIALNELRRRGEERTDTGVEQVLHELDLKRGYALKVTIARGADARSFPTSWIPDAWFAYVGNDADGPFRDCVALEVDMGTQEQKAWREKVAKILAVFADLKAYERVYGATALTVGVITTAGAKRLADLVRWTEAEMTNRDARQLAPRFLLRAAEPAASSGHALFLTPAWRRPFADPLVPLLEGVTPDTGA